MSPPPALPLPELTAGEWPTVHLSPEPPRNLGSSLAGGIARAQCDCDCACAVEGQGLLPTLSGPVACHLELTAACPNRCPGCGNPFLDRRAPSATRPPLPVSGWERILDKLLPQVSLIKLTGGEPSNYRGLFPLLKLLRERGVPFVMLTNGRWPQPHLLLERLSACPEFRGFLISLHGPDARGHAGFTATPGSFAAAVSAIRLASQAGFPVSVSTVLVRANLGRLTETADRALALGACGVIFNRYIGPPIAGLTLSERGLQRAVREAQSLIDAGLPVKFGNCVPQCFAPSSATGCTAGRSFFTVDPWGNVRPCNHAPLAVGNLLDESLEGIWWSEGMTQWREVATPECLDCAAYPRCAGGCRALSLGAEGDPLMRAPLASKPPHPPSELTLYASAVPRARYRVRHEPCGPALVHDGRVLLVSPGTLAFLDRVDRRCTLSEIGARGGPAALSLIGGLYTQRMLDLCVRPPLGAES
jgi:radical SAM protein with 4Fe4S-binding SPASM domain